MLTSNSLFKKPCPILLLKLPATINPTNLTMITTPRAPSKKLLQQWSITTMTSYLTPLVPSTLSKGRKLTIQGLFKIKSTGSIATNIHSLSINKFKLRRVFKSQLTVLSALLLSKSKNLLRNRPLLWS